MAGYERSNILVKVEDTFGQNFGLSFGTKRFDKTIVSQVMYLNRQGVLIIGRDGDIDPIYNSSESQGPLIMVSGPTSGIIELTSSQTGNTNGGIIGSIDFVNRGASTGFKRKSAIISQMSGTNGSSLIGSNLSFLTATNDVSNNGVERMRIDASGNVGIGTTNPTFTLDVSGNINIRGSLSRGVPVTKSGNFTVGTTENWIICNGAGTITVTLPSSAAFPGRELMFKNIAAQLVNSSASNVVPLIGGGATTAILPASAGSRATLVSDGTNWIIMQ